MLFELWERYRVLVITIGAVLFVAVSFLLYGAEQPGEMVPGLPLETPAYAAESEKPEATSELPGSRPANDPEQKQSDLFVDVKGSVKRPGVYRLHAGERVSAAIERAGGPLADADLDRVNLAQPLTDGSVVRIPKKGEAASPCGSLLPPAVPGQVISTSADQESEGKVNINTASLQELMTLPGIGETRAKAILAYRQQRGPFAAPEDLKQVTGIGEKMYAKLEEHIRVK